MTPGIDLWARGLPALAVVVGLVLILAWLARRSLSERLVGSAAERLTVVASRSLDPRNRIVLVRLDQSEILLAVGAGGIVRLTAGGVTEPARGEPT